jgi:hypothetical protein
MDIVTYFASVKFLSRCLVHAQILYIFQVFLEKFELFFMVFYKHCMFKFLWMFESLRFLSSCHVYGQVFYVAISIHDQICICKF